MFTQGQRLRMLASLLEMRPGLLTGQSCIGIVQPNPSKGVVNIGPNPTSGSLYISSILQQPSDVQLQVYNVNGQLIIQSSWDNIERYFSYTIDMTSWANGFYWLRLEIGGEELARKIIKY